MQHLGLWQFWVTKIRPSKGEGSIRRNYLMATKKKATKKAAKKKKR